MWQWVENLIIKKLFGSIGQLFMRIFQTQDARMKLMEGSVISIFLALRQAGITDVAAMQVLSQILVSDSHSEHWLVSSWRPIIALTYTVVSVTMLYLAYHGHPIPDMSATQMLWFTTTNTFICGYGVMRTIDKGIAKTAYNNIVGPLIGQIANKAGFKLPDSTPNNSDDSGTDSDQDDSK